MGDDIILGNWPLEASNVRPMIRASIPEIEKDKLDLILTDDASCAEYWVNPDNHAQTCVRSARWFENLLPVIVLGDNCSATLEIIAASGATLSSAVIRSTANAPTTIEADGKTILEWAGLRVSPGPVDGVLAYRALILDAYDPCALRCDP